MSQRLAFKWGNSNFAWSANPFPNQSKNPFTWNDCALVTEIVEELKKGGGSFSGLSGIWDDKRKKKRFIKLLCRVQGEEYRETKEVLDCKITVKDVELVVKEVLGVNIKINL